MKFILTDLKRIFTEPAFRLSVIFGLVLLFGGMVFVYGTCERERLFLFSQSFAFPFVAPLLSAMPYSVMIMQEKETRYKTLITIKQRGKSYEFKRFLTSGISGALALFIPQLLLFAVCFFMGGISSFGFDISVLLLSLSFGFSYGAVSYGLTFVNSQRYVPLVMPEIVYLLCIYAFPHLKLQKYYPPLDISPTIYGGEITAERFIIPVLLVISSLILTLIGKAGGRK